MGSWCGDPDHTDANHQYDAMTVTATIDSSPKPVAQGDTFAIYFPSELAVKTGTFAMRDPQGLTLATCDATTGSVVCTFTAAAAARSSVSGSLRVSAVAMSQTTSTTVNFTVDGAVIPVNLPGNAPIGPPGTLPYPQTPTKAGYKAERDGVITWYVSIPASLVKSGEKIQVLDQTLDGQTLLNPGTFRMLSFASRAAWNANQPSNEVGVPEGNSTIAFFPGAQSEVDLKVGGDRTSFELEFTNLPPNEDAAYRFYYETQIPAGTESGTKFRNRANVMGHEASSTVNYDSNYDGDLNGPGYGGISVKKSVSGPGSEVAAECTFSIQYAWRDSGGATYISSRDTKPGSASVRNDIPTGSKVTVTEVEGPSCPGAPAYTPVFSSTGAGVEIAPDKQSATVTVADQQVLELSLENVFGAVPSPTPTVTPTETPTATPTGTPTATPTGTPTASPTVTPTASPTATPTVTPTGSPSATPTAAPTPGTSTSPSLPFQGGLAHTGV